ncbi:MAG TPA: GntR family transcriptional regulator [Planctomycetota bacterium]|nr:GntR family transcriptional regulator [Planctomycetota bacterium]
MATTQTANGKAAGRTSSGLLADIRSRIRAGKFAPGEYLPTVRELERAHEISRKTVNAVLKNLEAEGLVAAEPRRGYRVLARAADPDQGCPLAYVADLRESPEQWRPFHQELLSAFQGAAARRSWTLLGVGSQGRDHETVMHQLTAARTCGLIIDSVDEEIMGAIRSAGLPAVAVDAWEHNLPIDVVAQDSYQGGVVAAAHLAAKGHQRIAWFGPTAWSTHSRARLAGTLAGLLEHGRGIDTGLIVSAPRDDSARQARELLSRADRPTGIVSLYLENAAQLVRTARELGLRLGRDLDLVGWCTEEQYTRDWLPLFGGEPPAPCAVWSPRLMAELAVDRLEARRKNPHLAPVRISVPVELRTK